MSFASKLLPLFFLMLVFDRPAFSNDKELRYRIEAKDCAVPVDDITGQMRARQWADIQSMGSRGRQELFEIVTQPRPKPDPSGSHTDWRSCALAFLARLKDPRAKPVARKILSAPLEDIVFKYEAANILGEFGDKEFVPLLASLLKSDDTQLADHVIEALGRIDDAAARAALRKALEDPGLQQQWPENPHLFYISHLREIIRNLGRQHDAMAFDALVRISKTDVVNEKGVRESLSYALAKIGIWNGKSQPAMTLIAESQSADQKRQILHDVIGGLWEDYWGNDPRFSESAQLADEIWQYEKWYPCNQPQ
jgi:hypothetical protein